MKPQALLLIALGLLLGPGYYLFCEHASGRSGQTYALTERGNRWSMADGSILRLRGGLAYKPLPLELTPASNDYRLRFSFNVTQADATDAANQYQVSLLQGDAGGAERSIQVKGRGAVVVTPDPLHIPYPGNYVLVLEEVGTPALTVSGVSLRIDADVQKPNMWIAWSGLALLILGIGVVMWDAIARGRRRY